MSVVPIGISPSDIVAGIKLGHKAYKALGNDQNGSEKKLQRTTDAVGQLTSAVESLSLSMPSNSASAQEALKALHSTRTAYTQIDDQLHEFELAPAPASKKKRLANSRKKLQFAFGGSQDVLELFELSQPGIDASIFRSIQHQNEQAKSRHRELLEKQDAALLELLIKIDRASSTARKTTKAFSKAKAKTYKNSKGRLKIQPPNSLRGHARTEQSLTAQYAASRKMLHEIEGQTALLLATSRQIQADFKNMSQKPLDMTSVLYELAGRLRNTPACSTMKSEARSILVALTSLPTLVRKGFKPGVKTLPFSSSSSRSEPLDYYESRDRPRLASAKAIVSSESGISHVVARATCCIVAAVIYQNTSGRKALYSMIQQADRESFSCLLWSVVFLLTLPLCLRMPAQICLVNDDCIYFETALGEVLTIPYQYWITFEIFEGFLNHHFNDKPGEYWVRYEHYTIGIGYARAESIEPQAWSHIVRSKMKLTMTMICNPGVWNGPECEHTIAYNFCPRCHESAPFIAQQPGMGGLGPPRYIGHCSSDTIAAFDYETRYFRHVVLRSIDDRVFDISPQGEPMLNNDLLDIFHQNWPVETRVYLANKCAVIRLTGYPGKRLNLLSMQALENLGFCKADLLPPDEIHYKTYDGNRSISSHLLGKIGLAINALHLPEHELSCWMWFHVVTESMNLPFDGLVANTILRNPTLHPVTRMITGYHSILIGSNADAYD